MRSQITSNGLIYRGELHEVRKGGQGGGRGEKRRDGVRQRLHLLVGGAALVCADDVSAPAVSLQSQTI